MLAVLFDNVLWDADSDCCEPSQQLGFTDGLPLERLHVHILADNDTILLLAGGISPDA